MIVSRSCVDSSRAEQNAFAMQNSHWQRRIPCSFSTKGNSTNCCMARLMSELPAFERFQKIARLHRDCVITEKIDGTNACVYVDDNGFLVQAASRTRWIEP